MTEQRRKLFTHIYFRKIKKKKKKDLFNYEILHKLVCTTFNSLLKIYYVYILYKYIHRNYIF